MTLNELAYRLFELYRGDIKDTDSMDIRLLKSWIQSTRAKLIKQQLPKSFGYISDTICQSLGQVEVEHVDSSIVSGLSTNTSLFRTKISIPRTIDNRGMVGSFKRIGPADRLTEKYDIVTLEQAIRSGYGRFNKNQIVSFVLDDKIYLYSRGDLVFMPQYIDVIGVFEDPVTAGKISDSNYNDDSPYPITNSMIEDMENMIINGKFRITVDQPDDQTEDSRHNPQ